MRCLLHFAGCRFRQRALAWRLRPNGRYSPNCGDRDSCTTSAPAVSMAPAAAPLMHQVERCRPKFDELLDRLTTRGSWVPLCQDTRYLVAFQFDVSPLPRPAGISPEAPPHQPAILPRCSNSARTDLTIHSQHMACWAFDWGLHFVARIVRRPRTCFARFRRRIRHGCEVSVAVLAAAGVTMPASSSSGKTAKSAGQIVSWLTLNSLV